MRENQVILSLIVDDYEKGLGKVTIPIKRRIRALQEQCQIAGVLASVLVRSKVEP